MSDNNGKDIGKALQMALKIAVLGKGKTVEALSKALGLNNGEDCDAMPGVLHLRDPNTSQFIVVEFEIDSDKPLVHKCKHEALTAALEYGTACYAEYIKTKDNGSDTGVYVPNPSDFAFIPLSEMELAEVTDTTEADAFIGSIRLRK